MARDFVPFSPVGKIHNPMQARKYKPGKKNLELEKRNFISTKYSQKTIKACIHYHEGFPEFTTKGSDEITNDDVRNYLVDDKENYLVYLAWKTECLHQV